MPDSPLCCLLWHLATPAWAEGNTESERVPRNGTLKYNKEMASFRETDGKVPVTCQELQGIVPQLQRKRNRTSHEDAPTVVTGIAGGNLPVFLPDGNRTVQSGSNPQALPTFPGINLDYKIGWGRYGRCANGTAPLHRR